MIKKRSNQGFSVQELLVVVAIIAVVGAITVVSVMLYMRSMAKLNYDNYAKEIFVAAQNHLAVADSQGYLGRGDFGTEEEPIDGISDTGDGVFYFVSSEGHDDVSDGGSVLGLMLPPGAVDETLRLDGRYIIRYHKDSAQVLDVFFWKDYGARYLHTYSDSDYADFLSKREDSNALKSYTGDRSVIGYYGGVVASGLTRGAELKAPAIVVENAETLTVTVTDFNRNSDPAKTVANSVLRLIITGVTSENSCVITLDPSSISAYYSLADISNDAEGNYVFNIVLDDVTSSSRHFSQLFCGGTQPLIPGEDIEIQAVSLNNTEISNVAYSGVQTTNSLFAYNTTDDGAAHIGYFRHLENLSPAVSDLAYTNEELSYVGSAALSAKQITDLTWGSLPGEYVYSVSGLRLTSQSDTYYPVSTDSAEFPGYTLEYDGDSHSVSEVVVDIDGYAGLFGKLYGGSVTDLKLLDFEVKGTDAGALAGVTDGTDVTNVIAYNTESGFTQTVRGTASTGGLIGSVSGGTLTKSAAALVVSSTGGNAGGLAGTVSDATVTACYSGGHTDGGVYDDSAFNVTASLSAGGLFGTAEDTDVSNSYSTCSAKGTVSVGGLVGTADGTFTSCYSTGLVSGTNTATKEGAFIGTMTGTASGCRYYEIINERPKDGDSNNGFVYLPPVGTGSDSGITALDSATAVYENNLVAAGERSAAEAYDSILNRIYSGKYPLDNVFALGAAADGSFVAVHHGDWPSPELKTVNTR